MVQMSSSGGIGSVAIYDKQDTLIGNKHGNMRPCCAQNAEPDAHCADPV